MLQKRQSACGFLTNRRLYGHMADMKKSSRRSDKGKAERRCRGRQCALCGAAVTALKPDLAPEKIIAGIRRAYIGFDLCISAARLFLRIFGKMVSGRISQVRSAEQRTVQAAKEHTPFWHLKRPYLIPNSLLPAGWLNRAAGAVWRSASCCKRGVIQPKQ